MAGPRKLTALPISIFQAPDGFFEDAVIWTASGSSQVAGPSDSASSLGLTSADGGLPAVEVSSLMVLKRGSNEVNSVPGSGLSQQPEIRLGPLSDLVDQATNVPVLAASRVKTKNGRPGLDRVDEDLSSLVSEGESSLAESELDGRDIGGGEGEAGSTGRLSCHTCGAAAFNSLSDQRLHFKSDWHRLNVKRRVANRQPITEEEFESMAQSGVRTKKGEDESDLSSVSGSEDESEAEAESRQSSGRNTSGSSSPKILLVLKGSGVKLAIWKVLLTGDPRRDLATDLLPRVRALTPAKGPSAPPLWVVLLCAGGHFAGIVVDTRGGAVLAHQTFHRYVVRAKAGGRQSTRDATGRAPKSAGASLRRYNEAALQKDIHGLLASWQSHLASAALILVYAPSSNQKSLFGSDEVVLRRDDPRVRGVPISIRRPTFKEAKRVAEALAHIDYPVDEAEPAEDDERNPRSSSHDQAAGAVPPSASGSGAETDPRGPRGAMQAAGQTDGHAPSQGSLAAELKGKPKKGRDRQLSDRGGSVEVGGGAVGAVGKEGEAAGQREEGAGAMDGGQTTELHEAAMAGNAVRVRELLEAGADPTVPDARGRPPYAAAGDKETRNAFRKFMAGAEERWDWRLAGVPSALTDEQEAAQAAKKAEKDAKRKAREKERRAERRAEERAQKEEAAKAAAEASAKATAEAALNAVRHGPAQGGATRGRGPSKPAVAPSPQALAEALAQERALRAAAAQRRLQMMAPADPASTATSQVAKTLGGPSSAPSGAGVPPAKTSTPSAAASSGPTCHCCGCSLVGKTPFHRLSYSYCSTTCVHVHRLAMEDNRS